MSTDHRREVSIIVFMGLLMILLGIVKPQFIGLANLGDIALNSSHLAIAALGMMLVVVIGQIDVSAGANLAISSTVAAVAAKAGYPLPLIAVMAIACGAGLGLINGLLVALFRVHSIVVTLGTLSIFRGLLIYFTEGSWIYGLPESFTALGQGRILGVPVPAVIALGVYGLAYVLLRSTGSGRAFYAVGSNPEAARLAGIDIARVQIAAFTLAGALVGLAALVFASRFTVIQSNSGIGFEFAVITAVLVGGANVFGGSGTPLGTLLGAVLTSAIGTVLVFLGANSYWEQALQGCFILIAVGLDRLRSAVGSAA